MTNPIDILNELKELSPLLAGMEKVNVFTVPAGYFERLGEDILFGLKEETGALLHIIPNPQLTGVPQGYFEALPAAILSKIKLQDNAATELKELSPMLYSVQNENVFTVPQGYFETLPGNILSTVAPQQAKVVIMSKRTAWFKYAVAAAFVGAVMFGAYRFIGKDDKAAVVNYAKINVDGELEAISDEAVVNFLTKDGVDIDAAVAVAEMQTKMDADELNNDKKDSDEIDELFNQLDENKKVN